MGLTIYLLLFTIIISKQIYLINEESLIMLTFISFIALSYNLISSLITSELDIRSEQLRNEFIYLNSRKEEFIRLLISSYKKQLNLYTKIMEIVDYANNKIINDVETKKSNLRKLLTAQQTQKLVSIFKKETSLLLEFRKDTTDSFSKAISNKIKLENQKDILNDSISQIESLKTNEVILNNELNHLLICNLICGIPFDTLLTTYFIQKC